MALLPLHSRGVHLLPYKDAWNHVLHRDLTLSTGFLRKPPRSGLIPGSGQDREVVSVDSLIKVARSLLCLVIDLSGTRRKVSEKYDNLLISEAQLFTNLTCIRKASADSPSLSRFINKSFVESHALVFVNRLTQSDDVLPVYYRADPSSYITIDYPVIATAVEDSPLCATEARQCSRASTLCYWFELGKSLPPVYRNGTTVLGTLLAPKAHVCFDLAVLKMGQRPLRARTSAAQHDRPTTQRQLFAA
ncbi:hypothetical protein J6590_075095 [Homalodisca vitripennis]|nr:hypothetical protein J6590_075095 [Homalodisca vitripennis]